MKAIIYRGIDLEADPEPISGSPYKVFVHPSPAVGPTSQAYGEGLINAVAGDDAFFRVRLRDQFQNIRRNRSDIDSDLLTAVAIAVLCALKSLAIYKSTAAAGCECGCGQLPPPPSMTPLTLDSWHSGDYDD